MSSILFVCLGNICRSPTAHGVCESYIAARGLGDSVSVDSAGTGAWHIGESPDGRATEAARLRGYELAHLRARQISVDDFYEFDYVLAMDSKNLMHLTALQPEDSKARVCLFLDFHPRKPLRDVPDPYYGGDEGFKQVLDLIESTCEALLDHVERDSE